METPSGSHLFTVPDIYCPWAPKEVSCTQLGDEIEFLKFVIINQWSMIVFFKYAKINLYIYVNIYIYICISVDLNCFFIEEHS